MGQPGLEFPPLRFGERGAVVDEGWDHDSVARVGEDKHLRRLGDVDTDRFLGRFCRVREKDESPFGSNADRLDEEPFSLNAAKDRPANSTHNDFACLIDDVGVRGGRERLETFELLQRIDDAEHLGESLSFGFDGGEVGLD